MLSYSSIAAPTELRTVLPCPCLPACPLLSTAVSGVAQLAGEVGDALHSTKSSSVKKSDSPNQAQGSGQLANVFAAYLAAAANSAHPPTPSPNVPIKGASKSLKEASASLSSLSVVLAVGPATAIAQSMALHAPPGVNPSPSKTAYTLAPIKGTSPTVQTAAKTLHPTAKQPSAPDAKTSSPSTGAQNLQTGSTSERTVSTTTAKSAAPAVVPAAYEQTTTEPPVLALHDVPGPHVQDSPQSAVVSSESSNGERTTALDQPNPHPPVDAGRSPLETLPAPEVSLQVQAVQTKLVGGAESARPISGAW